MGKDIQCAKGFNTTGMGPYAPPEYYDDGHYLNCSIDEYHGSHRLVAQFGYRRLAAMKRGVLLVRFETPFDIWCEGCGEKVAMGVRFDAEKTRAGKYHTTPLFNFMVKHFCGQQIVYQNDPRNVTYTVVSGARRKVNEWDPTEDQHNPIFRTKEERQALRSDVLAQVENQVEDEALGRELSSTLVAGVEAKRLDPHDAARILRDRIRGKRSREEEEDDERARLVSFGGGKGAVPVCDSTEGLAGLVEDEDQLAIRVVKRGKRKEKKEKKEKSTEPEVKRPLAALSQYGDG